jgi:hypothetical protein
VVNLKTNKIYIIFISLLLFLTAGCSNGIKNEENRIVVEKQVDQTDNYKYYNEVTNSKEVQKAKNILQSIK